MSGNGGGAGALLLGTGLVCAVGTSAPAAAAAVRAGISGARRSALHDRRYRPFTLATVPDEELPPLVPELEGLTGLTTRQARMLRLAGPALAEALGFLPAAGAPPPLLLATPEQLPGRPPPVDDAFLDHLVLQAAATIDPAASQLFPTGRAGGLSALAAGLELLASGQHHQVLVGGVDSCLDLGLLAQLDAEERILTQGVMDGFVPGEGAAFLLLGIGNGIGNGDAGPPRTRVAAVGEGEECGHRYSDAPYRGDGLATAFERLFAAAEIEEPAATVFAGLNGEGFGAKEWGVASLRHRDRIAESLQVEHPADCLGDTGAALGPQMVALAATGLERGYLPGPCLVWCSSDLAPRAATLLTFDSPGA